MENIIRIVVFVVRLRFNYFFFIVGVVSIIFGIFLESNIVKYYIQEYRKVFGILKCFYFFELIILFTKIFFKGYLKVKNK